MNTKRIIFLPFLSFFSMNCLYYEQSHASRPLSLQMNKEEARLVAFVQNAIDQSERFNSKMPKDMLFFGDHMTSPRSRHLLNNICSLPKARILEIGAYKGASIIAALYQNDVEYAYTIDNWSEFGGPKEIFLQNIKHYIPNAPLKVISEDSFRVEPTSLPSFNIYFYDGGHSQAEQEKAFTHFNNCFDNVFIAIVDDWMWEQVRIGTFQAFKKLNYTLLFEKEVALRFKDDIPWRFLYVAVIRK